MITAGGIVWLLYGFEIKSMPIIVGNLLGGIGIVTIMVGWFMYGRK